MLSEKRFCDIVCQKVMMHGLKLNKRKHICEVKPMSFFKADHMKILGGLLIILLLIPGVTLAKYKHIAEEYYKDSKHIYYKVGKEYILVKNADHETFEVLGHGYTKDKNGAYWEREFICGADPATFVVLDIGYAKDAHFVFYLGMLMEGTDAISFNALDIAYGKDADKVYYQHKAIKGADSGSFQILPYKSYPGFPERLEERALNTFAKDKKNVYYHGHILPGADPNTAQHLGYKFLSDKNSIYFTDYLLDTEPDGFEFLQWPGIAINIKTNSVFVGGGKVVSANIDVASLEILDDSYWKDKQNVYYYHGGNGKIWIVEGADPQTFEVSKRVRGYDAKDNKHKYFMGELL